MRTYRIAVLLNTSGAYGRGVFRGIMRYRLSSQHWQLLQPPWWADERTTAWEQWHVDGYIAEVTTQSVLRKLVARGLPVVNTAGNLLEMPLPTVIPDDAAVGRLAAEHFLERGFRVFGYVGARRGFSRRRGEGFATRLREAGFSCATCEVRPHDDRQEIEWLKSLPKPAGVFVHDDYYAACIMHRCQEADIAVPEHLAILGVDDNEFLRDWGGRSLSSVPLPADRIGYEAAALLLEMMEGRAAPRETILIPPLQPIARQSSDVLALHDPEVAAAVHFIREHIHEPIGVAEVLNAVLIGRRSLERRFQEAMGRTPLEEITRLRIERVQQLLMATDLPMSDIATRSGFTNATYMAATFRQKTHMTPRDYRKQFR